MENIKQIIFKILKFNVEFFKSMDGSAEELTYAVIILVLSSLSAGIGSISQVGIAGIVLGTIGALINWAVWATAVYFIVIRFLNRGQTEISGRELLILLAFSSAPGIIKIFGIVPVFHSFIFITANFWVGAVMIFGMDIKYLFKKRWHAPVAVISGWLFMAAVITVIGLSMKRFY